MSDFKQFARQCEVNGLEAVDYGNGHWQVRGGAVIVNYYPHSKRGGTVFISGTTRAMPFPGQDVGHVLRYAQGLVPNIRLSERPTQNQSRAQRKRLLAKDPHCHWCKCALTFATATLEHVIPLARGGSNHGDNLKLACRPCNDKHANKVEKAK